MTRRGLLPAIGLRLVFAFTPALDYAVGATAVSLPNYLLGSVVGLLPRILILSFFFTLATRSDGQAVTSLVPAHLVLGMMPLMRVAGSCCCSRYSDSGSHRLRDVPGADAIVRRTASAKSGRQTRRSGRLGSR